MRASPGETIAAISTALGPGAIAIVRLSGDRALLVADSVFRGRQLARCPTHTAHHGHIVDSGGREIDEVVATVMLAPNSYTTEDMVEFGCHGGTMPARRALEACLEAGARLARRGEFTQRAFLNGRLDLVQAEAVADVVAARTRRGLEVALGQLEGGLSEKLAAIRDLIVDFRAEVEALIDFADDEIGAGTQEAIVGLGRSARAEVEKLLSHCEVGVAIREGVSAAIVGKPNVGKSSLMNALLMRDRSIVTPLPGTTRDAIEEGLHVEGVLVRLIDTAGWRDAGDEAERAGVARARAAAQGADVVLFVVDGSSPLDAQDREIARGISGATSVAVCNKVDVGRGVTEREIVALMGGAGGGPAVGTAWVSAVTGEGLDRLRSVLVSATLGEDPSGPALLTNVRHIDALRRTAGALGRAEEMLAAGEPAELVAVEAGEAGRALGEVTGETAPEDVLDRIFERFCVGK
jgi:tRNA modification GTPase